MHFHEWNFLWFDSNFTEIRSWRSNWQYVGIGSGNAITWSHYLNQGWPSSPPHIYGTWGRWVKRSRINSLYNIASLLGIFFSKVYLNASRKFARPRNLILLSRLYDVSYQCDCGDRWCNMKIKTEMPNTCIINVNAIIYKYIYIIRKSQVAVPSTLYNTKNMFERLKIEKLW